MYINDRVHSSNQQQKPVEPNQPQFNVHKNHNFTPMLRRPNLMNMTSKSNGVFCTYSRLIPKQSDKQYEKLYTQNIQNKQKIRHLQSDNIKIKTRVSIIQKQKQHLLHQISTQNYYFFTRRKSLDKNIRSHHIKFKQITHQQNRKILHEYKDQINKLKQENNKIKKVTKYTKIQQLQIENQHLHSQLASLKQYMQTVLQQNEHNEYQKQIKSLTKQLQGQKNTTKTMHMQIKKKDQEFLEIKNKMILLLNRKNFIQKKYSKQLNLVKQQFLKYKQQYTLNHEKPKISPIKQNNSYCPNCKLIKNNHDKDKQINKQLIDQLTQKNQQISSLKSQFQQIYTKYQKSQIMPTNIYSRDKPKQTFPNNSELTKTNTELDQNKTKKQKQINQSQAPPNEENGNHPQKQKRSISNKSSHSKNHSLQKKEQQKNDQLTKKKSLPQNPPQQSQQNDYYQQSYENIDNPTTNIKQKSDDEQILYQKQQLHVKKKKSSSHHQKKNKKDSLSKPQKILRQTIKYRLISKRYTYADFYKQIKQSKVPSFTAQQLIDMLSNQPFYLSQDHLKMIILALFDKQDLQAQDEIPTSIFLKKMKTYLDQVKLSTEQQQQMLLRQIQRKLRNKRITAQLQSESNGKCISKKGFVKVLRQNGLTDQQIEQCLAQVSISSLDISQISYKQFIQKIIQ